MPASHALPVLPEDLHIAGSSVDLQAPTPATVTLPVLGSQPHISWSFVPEQLNTSGVMSERDVKTMKRKQANRDAARRSKVRRKLEAQALNARLKDLKGETNALQQEVSSLRATLSELVEENSRCRNALADGGLSTDEYPNIPVAFDSPPSPKLVIPGMINGEHAVGSIPSVLEFSHQYMSQLNAITEAGDPQVEAQPAIQTSTNIPILPERVETNNDAVIYLDANRTESERIPDVALPYGDKLEAD